MPDLQDFLPLFVVTIDDIRARVDADVNAGLVPADPGWIDTTPGGWYWDLTQAVCLEIERLWDVASVDLPASMFVGYAWGVYLDEHGAVLLVDRHADIAALGEVTFTGDDGTTIATDTRVATVQTDPDADPVEFATTSSGTIAGGELTLPVVAVVAGSAGNVPIGAISLVASSVAGVSAVTNAAATSVGADVETDEKYRERVVEAWQGSSGSGTVRDYERWSREYPGVGYATCTPLWAGLGTVLVAITDAANQPTAGALVDALQEQLDPVSASTTLDGDHTLPTDPITVVSTAGFVDEGAIVLAGGRVVTYTSLTATTFEGASGGLGPVASGSTVEQRGLGGGRAPVGAIVRVITPSLVPVGVTGQIVHQAGYSLTGENGTIETGADIEEVVGEYLNTLKPGADVVYNSVLARFFLVPGVNDVVDLRLNGTPTGVAVARDEVAEAGTFALT